MPLSALAMVAGGLTAGKGITASIIGNNAKQQAYRKQKGAARRAADLANQQISRNYGLTIENYLGNVQATEQQWNALINQSLADAAFLDEYAGDVYVQRQQKLNQVFAQEAFRQQDQMVRYMQSSGFAAASGRTGVTAGRGAVQNAAQLGRNQAIAARELIGTVDAFDKQSEIDNKRFSHEKYKIGQRAAILPSLGRVPDLPTFQQPAAVTRPSNSLAMDITSSLIDGVVTAVAVNPAKTGFKPPAANKGFSLGSGQFTPGMSAMAQPAPQLGSMGSGGFDFPQGSMFETGSFALGGG